MRLVIFGLNIFNCVDIEMVQTQVIKTCEVLIIYNNLQLFV